MINNAGLRAHSHSKIIVKIKLIWATTIFSTHTHALSHPVLLWCPKALIEPSMSGGSQPERREHQSSDMVVNSVCMEKVSPHHAPSISAEE